MRDRDWPDWAIDIQLSQVFKVDPLTWDNYEQSHISLIAKYLEGYSEGQG